MWMMARRIVSVALLSLAVSVGVASAQNYNYPTAPQPSKPPSGPAAQDYTVNTSSVTIQGKHEQVLTDAKGMTLYYFAADTPTTSACTGGCAKIWPPLLSTSAPMSGEKLPGKLAIVKDANGSQVSYNGHLLYTYSADTAAGQANGQGKAGKWWVATVDLKAATVAPSSTGTGRSGDYGGGKGGGW